MSKGLYLDSTYRIYYTMHNVTIVFPIQSIPKILPNILSNSRNNSFYSFSIFNNE